MRKFKAKYTEKFRDEQLKWFEDRMNQLPQSLQINEAAYSPNLRRTIEGLANTLRSNAPSITFAGYMDLLLQIREKLEGMGIKK